MSAAYVQTTRAIEAERPRTTAFGTIVAALFLAALGVWFFESNVTVYEVSKTARIETQSTPHAIDAPIAGRIVEVELVLARAEAARRRAETEALALNVVRQARDQRTRESQSFAQSEDLRRDLASLSGKQATTRATIDELTHDIEMRTIRAPAAGT